MHGVEMRCPRRVIFVLYTIFISPVLASTDNQARRGLCHMPNQTLSLKLPPTGTVYGLGIVKLTPNLIRLPKLASVVWAGCFLRPLRLSRTNLSPSSMVSSLEIGDEHLTSVPQGHVMHCSLS
ncbi:hypothetical protein IQ07DRAFT_329869 [Pyrenochaeta sp. DS3sAY3a]|nr:hypothetical protein IQ07DRAFT_329869 [Pyrenochaeta sp. DS3sAY3a]